MGNFSETKRPFDDHVRRHTAWRELLALQERFADCEGVHCMLNTGVRMLRVNFPDVPTEILPQAINSLEAEAPRAGEESTHGE